MAFLEKYRQFLKVSQLTKEIVQWEMSDNYIGGKSKSKPQ
jgi:hypothetical protein